MDESLDVPWKYLVISGHMTFEVGLLAADFPQRSQLTVDEMQQQAVRGQREGRKREQANLARNIVAVEETKGTGRIETTSDLQPRTERTGQSGGVKKPKQPKERARASRYRPNPLIAFHLASPRENPFRQAFKKNDGTYRI